MGSGSFDKYISVTIMLILTLFCSVLGVPLEEKTHCSIWVESFFIQYNLRGCEKHLPYRISKKDLLQECTYNPHTAFSKLEIVGEHCFNGKHAKPYK